MIWLFDNHLMKISSDAKKEMQKLDKKDKNEENLSSSSSSSVKKTKIQSQNENIFMLIAKIDIY